MLGKRFRKHLAKQLITKSFVYTVMYKLQNKPTRCLWEFEKPERPEMMDLREALIEQFCDEVEALGVDND